GEALGGDGATVERLESIAAVDAAADAAAPRIAYYLERFRRARLLEWVARCDGHDVVTFRSLTSGFGPAEGRAPTRPMTLSRFAYARRDGAHLVLESPETPCRAVLAAAGIELLRRVAEGRAAAPADDPLLALFWRAGFLEPADAAEADDRATWEFHDRLFHVASRAGRDAIVVGGTYRFKDRFPSPPAIKPPMSAEAVALPRPDVEAIAARSDPLAAIMDRRRSTRAHAKEPIRLETLSEFLFRVARITQVFADRGHELVSRPFPSGGSIHEIEFYLAVGACRGLEPGLYHYRGVEHTLERLPDTADGARRLLADAATAMGEPDTPQVLVVLAARLPRLAWKYRGLAYRVGLLNAGVVMQTMYLVATDMALAGCAVGSGDSRLFAEITRLDPVAETAIGEFALGAAGPGRDLQQSA
ncbi:MAG TPA: SagB family peptide dehydrogenase, partial [Solirubrobacteraceae bacterium]